MTVKELKKNNMAFKMKGSPIKNMSELRAKQRRMSRGESEFQYRNRMRREASAEAKKSIVPGSFSTKRKLEGDLVVNQDLMDKKISEPKKSNKIDWTKAPKVGTKARTKWYMKNNLALDDTTPSVKSTRDDFCTVGVFDLTPFILFFISSIFLFRSSSIFVFSSESGMLSIISF